MDYMLDPKPYDMTAERSKHPQWHPDVSRMRRLEPSISSSSRGTSSTGVPPGHAHLHEGLAGLPVDGHGNGPRAASGVRCQLGVRPVPYLAGHPERTRNLARVESLLRHTVSLFEVEVYSEQDGYSYVVHSASDNEILSLFEEQVRNGSSCADASGSGGSTKDRSISREQMLSMRGAGSSIEAMPHVKVVPVICAPGDAGHETQPDLTQCRSSVMQACSGTCTLFDSGNYASTASVPGLTVPDTPSACCPARLAPRSPDASSDPLESPEDDKFSAIDSELSDDYSDDEVVVGPTYLSVAPMEFHQIHLNDFRLGDTPVAIRSGQKCLHLSDVTRLGQVRQEAPVSFGSSRHAVFGPCKERCRPCMFERWPGRCTKAWLCDFCHLHAKKPRRDFWGKNDEVVSL